VRDHVGLVEAWMHIRAEGKYRKAVAGAVLTSPSKLRQAATASGELEAKRSTWLPGMQRGSRKGSTSQRQYERWLLGDCPVGIPPHCNLAWRP
jgi:hypothetical protein